MKQYNYLPFTEQKTKTKEIHPKKVTREELYETMEKMVSAVMGNGAATNDETELLKRMNSFRYN